MASLKYYNKTTNQWESISTGSKGESDVHIGDFEPSDGSTIWIDTDDNSADSGGNKDYVLTDADKDEIAEIVKAEVPLVKTAEQPTFVNSVDEMTDPTEVYVMPDGYLYGYREIENYNLLKLSEVTYNARLDNTSSEIMTSTLNAVSGWFPVTYGKYYAPSIYRSDLGYRMGHNLKFARVQLKLADGNIKIYTNANGGNEYPGTNLPAYSNSAVYGVDDENAVAMRVHFSITINSKQQPLSKSEELRTHQPMIVEGDTVEDAMLNTLNLEYIDGDEAGIAEWYNTGLMYNLPADYEDRIIELETAQIDHEERIDKLETKKYAELALQGKKWTVIGDSHTEQNSCATKRYYDYIAENTGISVTVNGIGGTGYKNGEANSKAYYHRVLNISADTDVVTLFTSNNDLLLGAEIGTYTDTTTDTICGCINKTIDNLFSVLPTVKLGIITNVPGSSYNPMSTAENANEKLADAVVELCRRRGIPCLDLFHSSGLRPWDANFKELCYKHDPSKGHFDEDGHAFIAPRIKSLLESIIM